MANTNETKTTGAAAKAGAAAGKVASREATTDEVRAANAGSNDGEEVWGRIPTGQKFYIAKKNFGVSVEGYAIGAKMNNIDSDRPFLSYTIRTTVGATLTDQDDTKFEVPVGSNVNIVATSDLKGPIREAALDPDNVLKMKFMALRERDIGKGRKYIDYDVQCVMEKDGVTPKKFARSSIAMAQLQSGDEGVEQARQIESGA